MEHRKRAILIFSKSPESGKVKTRLRPFLTDEQCLSLHIALLRDTINKCSAVPADLFLYLTAHTPLTFITDLPVKIQEGADLGERMRNAFSENLANYKKVLITGIDSPGYPISAFEEAFLALDHYDLVLGPCDDGGYYLIGLRKMIPQIFENVPWGTSEVLKTTLALSPRTMTTLLPLSYDIDLPADLDRLRQDVQNNKDPNLQHSRKFLRDLRAES